MLHHRRRQSLSQTIVLMLVMALGLVLVGQAPATWSTHRIEGYLPLHTIIELVAVVISALVFVAGWNAHSHSLLRHTVILACAFLGVAVLDVSHALSYAGMPAYVTPNSPEKAIHFWLAARLLAAVALLAVVSQAPRPLRWAGSRHVCLFGVLGFVVLAHLVFFLRPQWLPRTFASGTGLTAFKIAVEYLVIGLNLLTATILWRGMSRPQPQSFNAAALFQAVCAMALSEVCFTLYGQVSDLYNLLGHVYKVVSYGFLFRAVFVEAIDQPYRELASMRDQLRATLDAVPDVMIETDLQGHYHAIHSARPESLLRPADKLLGKTIFDVLPAEQARAIVGMLQEAQRQGSASGLQVPMMLTGQERWFELSVARKGQDEGEDTRFIVLSRDITERKQAQALLLAQEAATQASLAKSEFLSRVSHELRTPLNAVIGFAQLLLHGQGSSLAAGQKLHVEYILRAGQHLLEMINDIMDLTRIESGDAHLQLEAVSLPALIQEALPMVLTQADAMGVTVQAQALQGDRHAVMADRRRLKQVLLNVLSNAVKYNRLGGQVSVRCEPSSSLPMGLDIVVSDTGRGLSEAQLQGLFEPFNRLGAEQQGIEGTGLGLVISRRLVQAMAGTISLHSTPGVGTVVTLSLPHAKGVPVQAPLPAASTPQAPADEKLVATVLCVEDNPLNAALLRAIFDLRPGVRLVLADDGHKALGQLPRVSPDLVLIDINLPDMPGDELLRRLRLLPQGRDVLCMAMSADVAGDPLARARQQGFADFWPKPLDVHGVLRRLDAVLSTLDAQQRSLWSQQEFSSA